MSQLLFYSEKGDWSYLAQVFGRAAEGEPAEEKAEVIGEAADRTEARPTGGPSYPNDVEAPVSGQRALDALDEASMESFPCSDPPSSSHAHA